MKPLSVTLDTNVMKEHVIRGIQEAATGLAIHLAHISVTERELEITTSPKIMPAGECILETGVYGESRYGDAIYGDEFECDLFERLLVLVSNGSFPRSGDRENLSHGQISQRRDMMILVAHVRSGRDILVTNDKKAFIGNGSLRNKLETLCSTRIMNADEFCAHCAHLKRAGGVVVDQDMLPGGGQQ